MSDEEAFATNLATIRRWRDDLAFQEECADRAARQRGEGAGVSRSRPDAVLRPAKPVTAVAPEDAAERRRTQMALRTAAMQADIDRQTPSPTTPESRSDDADMDPEQ